MCTSKWLSTLIRLNIVVLKTTFESVKPFLIQTSQMVSMPLFFRSMLLSPLCEVTNSKDMREALGGEFETICCSKGDKCHPGCSAFDLTSARKFHKQNHLHDEPIHEP
jgi:hypothetical protein